MRKETPGSIAIRRPSVTRILGAPSVYIQGPGVIEDLGAFSEKSGKKAFILSDETVWNLLGEAVETALSLSGVAWELGVFCGECCHEEIDRLHRQLKLTVCDHIIGLGGGKVLDTAKGVGIQHSKCPLIIVPTVAASDSATSRICVVYHPSGRFQETMTLAKNPAVVLVDSQIIANAPVRYIIAGMGDALATKFEAFQCAASGAYTSFGAGGTHTAMCIAEACYRSIRQFGITARKDMEQHRVTHAVETIIEACIYQSGIGFEGGGLSAAHGLTRGLSRVQELKQALHGEMVAFALLVQLVMEERNLNFMLEIIDFYRRIGLPCSLSDLGLNVFSENHLMTIANHSCVSKSPIYNMDKTVTPMRVRDAIDKLHNYYLTKGY